MGGKRRGTCRTDIEVRGTGSARETRGEVSQSSMIRRRSQRTWKKRNQLRFFFFFSFHGKKAGAEKMEMRSGRTEKVEMRYDHRWRSFPDPRFHALYRHLSTFVPYPPRRHSVLIVSGTRRGPKHQSVYTHHCGMFNHFSLTLRVLTLSTQNLCFKPFFVVRER